MNKSLKAQFKYADRQGFLYVLTVGEGELQSGVFNVKRMSDGVVTSFDRARLVDGIKRLVE